MNGYLNGQTAEAIALFERESEAMDVIKQQVIRELASLARGKTVYDAHFPWWQKHVFGDASYAHELVKKALRAASLVAANATGDVAPNEVTDKLEDCILDAINFCVMWLAWRRYVAKGEEHASSAHHAAPSDPFDRQ